MTSVPKEHVHVVQMLCAPTLRDRTSVPAKLDTLRMEMSAINVSFSFYVFMGFLVTTIFFLMLNALHLYSLRGLAFDSNMQYHPFTVCRFRRSNFVLICNSLCSFDQFACIVGFWRKLDNYDTHMNTELQTRLQGR